ncbi:MAG: HlyC/CorC family transporter [Ruminococcaceae bacterium]|nr:HlyC/CorC family transporter [Oscillospiraceae bacterium]
MINVIIIIICLICSAFFSSSEITFASANKVRLKRAAEEKGSTSSKLAYKIYNNYESALATILIGNNLVNIASESVATVIVIGLLGASNAWIATIVMTIIVLICGEIVPKVIVKTMPETFATIFAIPLYALMVITKPIVVIVDGLIKLLSYFWKKGVDTTPISKEELETILDTVEDEGIIDEEKCDLLQSAFDFNEVQAYEIITPRVDMTTIDIECDREEMLDLILSSAYTRIPVYKDTIDNIIGILHVNLVMRALTENPDADICGSLLEPVFVHKTMPLDDVLAMMRIKRSHLVIVTDEYGGVMGILTMEDVMEQLVGDIWDENDEIEPEVVELSDGILEIDGDMRIEDFFDEVEFDDRDFDDDNATVGGFVVQQLGHYAECGDKVDYENLSFTVLETDNRRIERLKVEILPKEDEITEEKSM